MQIKGLPDTNLRFTLHEPKVHIATLQLPKSPTLKSSNDPTLQQSLQQSHNQMYRNDFLTQTDLWVLGFNTVRSMGPLEKKLKLITLFSRVAIADAGEHLAWRYWNVAQWAIRGVGRFGNELSKLPM